MTLSLLFNGGGGILKVPASNEDPPFFFALYFSRNWLDADPMGRVILDIGQ